MIPIKNVISKLCYEARNHDLIFIFVALLISYNGLVSAEQDGDKLLINLEVDGTSVAISGIQRISYFPSDSSGQDSYKLLDKKGSVIEKGSFSLSDTGLYDEFTGDNQLKGGPSNLSKFEKSLVTSYSDEIYRLEIWKGGNKKVLDTQISDRVDYRSIKSQGSVLLNNCVTIQDNGPSSEKLDIVYVGSGYSESQLQRFAQDVILSKIFLMSVTPFNEGSNRINVHYVNQAFDLLCNRPEYRYCEESRVINAANQCPMWDKVVVLSRTLTYRGGGYASSLNGFLAVAWLLPLPIEDLMAMMTVIHELGHTLALGDEYYLGRGGSGGLPPPPNCDSISTCPRWAGMPGTSCIPICGYTDYFRSVQDGIMYSANIGTAFGPVSERHLLVSRLAQYTPNLSPRLILDVPQAIPQGNTLNIRIQGTPNTAYFIGLSLGYSGFSIPKSGGGSLTILLSGDALFFLSTSGLGGLFTDYVGILDGNGQATAHLQIPNGYSGIFMYIAGITYDNGGALLVSNTHPLLITFM